MPLPLYGGRYQLEELLGRGGMGQVYRATDRRTGGTVAVKVITSALAADPQYLERLRREARITASLTSPRVVRVIDLDEHEGAPFVVLEYVAGPTLDELLGEQGPFPVREAMATCLEVARALEAAHARGIVHRDLKPENIKVVDGQVKVLDFGIARVEGDAGVTSTGLYIGTPYYSAPERVAGTGDIRADIYAVGAILFELLTGGPPFDGPTPIAILMQHATAPPPELPADVPRPVRALVSRCLAKSPEDRYQTPAELVAALSAVLGMLPGDAGVALARGSTPERSAPEAPRSAADAQPSVSALDRPLPLPLDTATSAVALDRAPPTAGPREAGTGTRSRRPIMWAVAGVGVILAVALAAAVLANRQSGGGAAPPSAPVPSPTYGARASAVEVTTLAGSGEYGVADGRGGVARFVAPVGVAVDGKGTLYLADSGRIRRVSATGEVTTLAGSDGADFVDGPIATARFNSPRGIAVDAAGTLYVADSGNHRIRKVSPEGVVSTLAGTGAAGLADGPGISAQFNSPYDVAVDATGTVYVADALNNRIRRIGADGVVTTLAGGGESGDFADGPGQLARFNFPTGLAVDTAGTVYVADTYNARIRAVSSAGAVRTIAGSGEDGGADGTAALARFSDPYAITVDRDGNLYVLDKNNRIRLVSPDGVVTTLAGSGVHGFADGPAPEARFDGPVSVAARADGTVFVADTGNRRIRTVPVSP